MKYTFAHKFFSVSIAFLVLFSTVSFAVAKHFCGDMLVDTAVFSEVEKCHTESEKEVKMDCCSDEVQLVKGQTLLAFESVDDFTFQQKKLLTAFASSYIHLFTNVPQETPIYTTYHPPNLVFDIQVRDQVFII